MTMEEAHKKLLEMLEEVFQGLMAFHIDKDCFSPNNEYKYKVDEFHRIQDRIFTLKNLWYELRDE